MSEDQEFVEVDEILVHIGEFKKSQIIVLILLSLLICCSTFQILNIIFVSLDSPWMCSSNGIKSGECLYNGTFAASHQLYHKRCTMNRTAWKFIMPKGYSIVTEVRI